MRAQSCAEESTVPPDCQIAPDLATRFSRVAEFDLGIDVCENTPLSNFVSKLLDMGNLLQVQLRFADQDVARLQRIVTKLEAERGAPENELTRSPCSLVLTTMATKLIRLS